MPYFDSRFAGTSQHELATDLLNLRGLYCTEARDGVSFIYCK
jgi:hypothetical protein